jgi:hypothetical protein
MSNNGTLFCGVKYCGGCNPRYERREVLENLKTLFLGRVDFEHAKEDVNYDVLVVIGGCTNCCASYEQYSTKRGILKIWEESGIAKISDSIEKIIITEV